MRCRGNKQTFLVFPSLEWKEEGPMTGWISQNGELVRLGLDSAMTVVWIAYLHVFAQSMRRQRRSDIHISQSADGSWFVSNLGLEPIFVSNIIAEMHTGDDSRVLDLTDRCERTDSASGESAFVITHGPMSSGGYTKVCDRKELSEWIRSDVARPDELEWVTLSVLAETAATDTPVGASRRFRVRFGRGGARFLPETMRSRQIRGRRKVRRLMGVVRSTSYGAASD